MPQLNFNDLLVIAFKDLLNQKYLATEKGDAVDTRLREVIETKADIKSVNAKAWKTASKYKDARGRVAIHNFSLVDNFQEPFIVDKPKGSQNWPDCLIVYKNKALPIEFKRSESGIIVWNSGLPHHDGIYVFNGVHNDVTGTTFFLGQDLISDDIRQKLTKAADDNKSSANDFNRTISSSGWTLYARPMFNNGDKILTSPDRANRERRVLDFLATYKWD